MNSVETETQVRLPWQKGIPLVWSEFFSSQAFECPICESESLEMRTRNWLKKRI